MTKKLDIENTIFKLFKDCKSASIKSNAKKDGVGHCFSPGNVTTILV